MKELGECASLQCRFLGDLFAYASKRKECSSKTFVKAYVYSSLAKRVSSAGFLYDCLSVPSAYESLAKEKKLTRGKDVYPSFVMEWIGYMMAYYSAYTGLPASVFYSKVKPEELYRMYEAYHSLDRQEALERIAEATGILLDFSPEEALKALEKKAP